MPARLLKAVQPLADFDFALTHLVLSDPRYARYYKESTRFKMLDNSTNENLKPCSLRDIKTAADIIKPDLVVAPDYLGDSKATIGALEGTIKIFGWDKVLPVVQGNSPRSVLICLKAIVDRGFNCVAVPYDICCNRTDSLETMAAARLAIVNLIINRVSLGFRIHLLGMTTPEELGQHNLGWVKSMDTGSPILHGLVGRKFGECTLIPKTTPTFNLMQDSKVRDLKTIYYNIAYLRKVLQK